MIYNIEDNLVADLVERFVRMEAEQRVREDLKRSEPGGEKVEEAKSADLLTRAKNDIETHRTRDYGFLQTTTDSSIMASNVSMGAASHALGVRSQDSTVIPEKGQDVSRFPL